MLVVKLGKRPKDHLGGKRGKESGLGLQEKEGRDRVKLSCCQAFGAQREKSSIGESRK